MPTATRLQGRALRMRLVDLLEDRFNEDRLREVVNALAGRLDASTRICVFSVDRVSVELLAVTKTIKVSAAVHVGLSFYAPEETRPASFEMSMHLNGKVRSGWKRAK